MKSKNNCLLLAVMLGMVIPSIVLMFAQKFGKASLETNPSMPDTQASESLQITDEQQITIPVLTADAAVQQFALDEYLVGVVLAEMPANFQFEAKKAQAVAARTVTLRSYDRGGKHEDAVVCTQSSCCQAYISEQAYLAKGGKASAVEQARKAVQETAGQAVYYKGKLIDATYFSCSGGRTEDAVAVWGSNVAYLQAVDSPGEEIATHYTDEVSFSAATFCKKLGVSLKGAPEDWFGKVSYTDGGGVKTMLIGGKSYTGTQLRSLLGLRSTAFTVHVTSGKIIIKTSGYGHRVGMSQYGAQAMALKGSTYQEILAHYYTGTKLGYYNCE